MTRIEDGNPVEPLPAPSEVPSDAVLELSEEVAAPTAVWGLEPDDLDGYSIDDLADYLDAGMTPPDPVIDMSPSCQIALNALARLKSMARMMLDDEAAREAPRDDSWMTALMQNITMESRAGRQIPFRTANLRAELTITEGAVRGLIRAAGDTVHGILVGKSTLTGDVGTLDEPIQVEVDAAILWRNSIPDAANQLRDAIHAYLAENTDLVIAGITITISDVQVTRIEEIQ